MLLPLESLNEGSVRSRSYKTKQIDMYVKLPDETNVRMNFQVEIYISIFLLTSTNQRLV